MRIHNLPLIHGKCFTGALSQGRLLEEIYKLWLAEYTNNPNLPFINVILFDQVLFFLKEYMKRRRRGILNNPTVQMDKEALRKASEESDARRNDNDNDAGVKDHTTGQTYVDESA